MPPRNSAVDRGPKSGWVPFPETGRGGKSGTDSWTGAGGWRAGNPLADIDTRRLDRLPAAILLATTAVCQEMGFDKVDTGPAVNVHKKTTKVNLWMAGLVLVFLVAGGLIVVWAHSHSAQVTATVNQQSTKPQAATP